MIDFYLTKFYNDVKDSSWPDIQTLADLHHLPTNIKHELIHHFNALERLSEIESVRYWRENSRHTSIGYKKDNLLFVPVLKCASTFFKSIFSEQLEGWSAVNIYKENTSNLVMFGTIMHPLKRRIKGLVENLVMSYKSVDDLNIKLDTDPEFRRFISYISSGDSHTLPYNIMYGDLLKTIKWFPLDIGIFEVISCINTLFSEHNLKDKINPESAPLHVSKQNQVVLYQKLVDIYFNNPDNELSSILLYADDLKFYHNLLREYDITVDLK